MNPRRPVVQMAAVTAFAWSRRARGTLIGLLLVVGALVLTGAYTASVSRGPVPALPYYDGPDFTPRWTPVVHRVGDFQLVTQTGRQVTRTDLSGRIHVASFLFTTCPTICPTLVQQLERVQEATRDVPNLLIVSYSVTPATDTPARLAEFGRERGIDPSQWLLLTGEASVIAALARESYFADDSRLDRSAPDQVLHTEKLLLVDGDGHLRGIYNGTIPFEVNRLIEDIRALR